MVKLSSTQVTRSWSGAPKASRRDTRPTISQPKARKPMVDGTERNEICRQAAARRRTRASSAESRDISGSSVAATEVAKRLTGSRKRVSAKRSADCAPTAASEARKKYRQSQNYIAHPPATTGQ